MTKPYGFYNNADYMGRIDGKWQQFATEEEYKEALNEERELLCICGRELQSED